MPVRRSGEELVQFAGAVNVFDVLEGISSDLRNTDGLEPEELFDRLEMRLGELDRNRTQSHVIATELDKKERFSHVAYLEIQEFVHTWPPRDWFERAVQSLDEPLSTGR